MKGVSVRLLLARKHKGWSQAKLSEFSGVPQQTIATIELGKTQAPREIFKLASALSVDARWLAGEIGEDNLIIDSESPLRKDSISLTSIGRVTVRGIVEASNWAEACEWDLDQQYQEALILPEGQEMPYKIENLFALEVRGESMNVEYKPGWKVVCISVHDDIRDLRDGDNVIVRRESFKGCESTVKKLRINPVSRKYELHFNSINPDYKGILPISNLKTAYTVDDITISIVARVVFHIPSWG